MSVLLPYFKFYPGEWLAGDIQGESKAVKGVFADIVALYWNKECEYPIEKLRKRLAGCDEEIDALISSGILHVDEGGNVKISFLKAQANTLPKAAIASRENGKKGGRPKKEKEEGKKPKKPTGLISENLQVKKSEPKKPNIEEEKEEEYNNTPVSTGSVVDFDRFISLFNSIGGRNFKVTKKVKDALLARIKVYTPAQIYMACQNAYKDPFHIERNFKFLTPEFCLREDKVEMFLNATPAKKIIDPHSLEAMIPGN